MMVFKDDSRPTACVRFNARRVGKISIFAPDAKLGERFRSQLRFSSGTAASAKEIVSSLCESNMSGKLHVHHTSGRFRTTEVILDGNSDLSDYGEIVPAGRGFSDRHSLMDISFLVGEIGLDDAESYGVHSEAVTAILLARRMAPVASFAGRARLSESDCP